MRSGCAASSASASAGSVRARPSGTANPHLASGQVELLARELEILSRAETPPFHHDEVDERGVAAQVSLSRSASRRDAEAPAPASSGDARDARISRRARLHRHRNADADQGDAGRRARLSRAEPHASRSVLRAAAVAAAVQAAAHDERLRSLLSDRALLPRRGSARRASARIHAARYRNLVHERRARSCS